MQRPCCMLCCVAMLPQMVCCAAVVLCCTALWLQDFRVPREIVWLNGAPGSGKVSESNEDIKTCC